MFCKNCGQELVNNTKFCGHCGTAIEANEAFNNSEAPAQYEATPEVPVSNAPAEETNFAQANFNPTPAKKPKMKLKPIIIASVAVVLVVAIVLTIVFINKNKNKNNNENIEASFGNMINVLSQNTSMDKKVDAVMDSCNSIAQKFKTGTNMQFKINLSDETAQLLNSLVANGTGNDIDFAALNGTALNLNVHSKDNFILFETALNCGGKDLIDARIIIDTENFVIYMGSPSLSETYLTISVEELLDEMGVDAEMLEMYLSVILSQMDTSFLPTMEEIEKLVDTYSSIIISGLTTDRESSTTITVNGISQQVTECTIEVTEGDVQQMALNALKTFKNDDNAKGILEKTLSLLSKCGIDELENFSMSQLDLALDLAISSFESNADFSASNEVIMTLTRYVDSNDMIVGRNLVVEDETILYHATATSGSSYASTFEIEDSVRINGNGTVENGRKTGTYTVIDGSDTLTFNLKDFCIDSNGINGSFIYYIEADMLADELDLNNSLINMLTNGAKPGVEFKFSSTEDSGGFEFNLIAGEKVLLGVSINAESAGKTDISAPSNTMSIREADRWAESIDEEAFMKKIEDSPLGFIITMLTAQNKVESRDAIAIR